MVIIEAMACGTPTVAFRAGAVPEIIEDRTTGFIVDDVDEAVAALERVPTLSRRRCRERFEAHFTAERMAAEYVSVYEGLTSSHAAHRGIPEEEREMRGE